ncbi:hypothetical protein AABB24_006810, partial [Solanum stoloniferum]
YSKPKTEEPFNSPSAFEKIVLFQCHIASNITVRLIDTWLCKAAMTPTPSFGLIRTIQSNPLVMTAGGVNVIVAVVSFYYVDKLGMRLLFLEGGVQMLFCQDSHCTSIEKS